MFENNEKGFYTNEEILNIRKLESVKRKLLEKEDRVEAEKVELFAS